MSRVGSANRSGELLASDDEPLLCGLRDGDERVFADLVERWSGIMLRLALAQDARERIRAALERRLAAYANDAGFDVPVSVKLATGRKSG